MSFVERLSSLGAGTVSRVLCREVVLFGRFKMNCRKYTGTVSHVLCREVVLFGSWDSKSCPL